MKQQKNKNEQQKNKNEQQRDRITAIETSATEKERKELAAQKNKARRVWMVWVILAAIIVIAVAASQGNNIKANSEQIASNSAEIAVNLDQTKSNLQLIEYLLSNAGYIYEYIGARGKVLPGIKWGNNVENTGTFYGPTFYLGQCKLRLKAVVTSSWTAKRASYYVERLKGEYDDTIDDCIITYSYASYWYLGATQPEDTNSYNWIIELKVGGSQAIGVVYWRYTNRKVVVRVYFDTVGT